MKPCRGAAEVPAHQRVGGIHVPLTGHLDELPVLLRALSTHPGRYIFGPVSDINS